MKRGGPLKRNTPLRRTAWGRYNEIARKAWTRKPSKPAVPQATKTLLAERSQGWCEFGLMPGCSRYATDPHHRKGRKAGGRGISIDGLSNLLHLCRQCHQYVTSPSGERRQYALDTGLIVLEHEDPFSVPVNTPAFAHLYSGPVHLSPCGGVWPADLTPIETSDTKEW